MPLLCCVRALVGTGPPKDDQRPNPFAHLPVELLIEVFDHLDVITRHAAAQVCRSWHTASRHGVRSQVDQMTLARARQAAPLLPRHGSRLRVHKSEVPAFAEGDTQLHAMLGPRHRTPQPFNLPLTEGALPQPSSRRYFSPSGRFEILAGETEAASLVLRDNRSAATSLGRPHPRTPQIRFSADDDYAVTYGASGTGLQLYATRALDVPLFDFSTTLALSAIKSFRMAKSGALLGLITRPCTLTLYRRDAEQRWMVWWRMDGITDLFFTAEQSHILLLEAVGPARIPHRGPALTARQHCRPKEPLMMLLDMGGLRLASMRLGSMMSYFCNARQLRASFDGRYVLYIFHASSCCELAFLDLQAMTERNFSVPYDAQHMRYQFSGDSQRLLFATPMGVVAFENLAGAWKVRRYQMPPMPLYDAPGAPPWAASRSGELMVVGSNNAYVCGLRPLALAPQKSLFFRRKDAWLFEVTKASARTWPLGLGKIPE